MDAALRTLRTDSSAGGDHEATLLILRDDVATAASWSIVQHVSNHGLCAAGVCTWQTPC